MRVFFQPLLRLHNTFIYLSSEIFPLAWIKKEKWFRKARSIFYAQQITCHLTYTWNGLDFGAVRSVQFLRTHLLTQLTFNWRAGARTYVIFVLFSSLDSFLSSLHHSLHRQILQLTINIQLKRSIRSVSSYLSFYTTFLLTYYYLLLSVVTLSIYVFLSNVLFVAVLFIIICYPSMPLLLNSASYIESM